MRNLLIILAVIFLTTTFTSAQRKAAKAGTVCGDPNAACASRSNFNDQDIPFEHGKNYAVAESEKFYIVILKSYKVDALDPEEGRDACEVGPPDTDRSNAQFTFKKNKIFFARGCYSIENSYYTGIDEKTIALAAFAGRTKAEADRFLSVVKKAGYRDAYLKRITTGFNGT